MHHVTHMPTVGVSPMTPSCLLRRRTFDGSFHFSASDKIAASCADDAESQLSDDDEHHVEHHGAGRTNQWVV